MEDIELLVPEFEYRKKDTLWYLYFFLVAAILMVFGYLTENYLFMGLVFLGGSLLLFRSFKKPGMIMFAIHDDGIYIQNKHYLYKDIKNYSIYSFGDQHYFVFYPRNSISLPVHVPISDPEKVREKISNAVPETEYEQSLLEALIRLFGL